MIDAREVIELVKRFPEIWDSTCDAYADKQSKKNAWDQIFNSLLPEFPRRSAYEREKFGRLVMGKWRNVKDGYIRSLRKKKFQTEFSRPYVFARQLSFLSREDPSADVSAADDKSQSSVDEMTVEPPLPQLTSHISSTTLSTHYDPLDQDVGVGVGVGVGMSPSMGFFDSLRPAVDSFTVDEMLRFQREVLSVVTKIRNERKIRKLRILRRKRLISKKTAVKNEPLSD